MNYKSISFLIVLFLSVSFTHMLKARFNLKKTNSPSLLSLKKQDIAAEVEEILDEYRKKGEGVGQITHPDTAPTAFLQSSNKVELTAIDANSLRKLSNREAECAYFSNACDFYSGTITKFCATDSNTSVNLSKLQAKSYISNFTIGSLGIIHSSIEAPLIQASLPIANTAIEHDPYVTSCVFGSQAPFATAQFGRSQNLYRIWNSRGLIPTSIDKIFPSQNEDLQGQLFLVTRVNSSNVCNQGELRKNKDLDAVWTFSLTISEYDKSYIGFAANFINSYTSGGVTRYLYAGKKTTVTLTGTKGVLTFKEPINTCQIQALGSITNISYKVEPEAGSCD